jgi:hypothetical protein
VTARELFAWLEGAELIPGAVVAGWNVPEADKRFLEAGIPQHIGDSFEADCQEATEPEMALPDVGALYRFGNLRVATVITGRFAVATPSGKVFFLPFNRDGTVNEEYVRFVNSALTSFFGFLNEMDQGMRATNDQGIGSERVWAVFGPVRERLRAMDRSALRAGTYWGQQFAELKMEFPVSGKRDASDPRKLGALRKPPTHPGQASLFSSY